MPPEVTPNASKIPEAKEIDLAGDPFGYLWDVAQQGTVIGKDMRFGFERTIGEDNQPLELSINVYQGENKERIWGFDISANNVVQENYPRDETWEKINIPGHPLDGLPAEEKRRIIAMSKDERTFAETVFVAKYVQDNLPTAPNTHGEFILPPQGK